MNTTERGSNLMNITTSNGEHDVEERTANGFTVDYCVTHGSDAAACRAADALQSAPIETLLRSAYSLTHRMDAADRERRAARSCGQQQIEREAWAQQRDLRAQRDLIDAEIARRCAR